MTVGHVRLPAWKSAYPVLRNPSSCPSRRMAENVPPRRRNLTTRGWRPFGARERLGPIFFLGHVTCAHVFRVHMIILPAMLRS